MAKADPKEASIEVSEVNVAPTVYINKQITGLEEGYVPRTFEQMYQYALDHDGEIIEFEGSAWELLKDKSKLVDVPFMIADVRHYDGQFGGAVAVMLITQQPLPGFDSCNYVINDGSTGLYQQVVNMIYNAKQKTGILCKRGLRASSYDYEAPDGNIIPATTYYVA